MSGLLTVCGTPIGNLGDITLRALETLKNADYIAAEDTRHTIRLLQHYDIKTPLISYHEHSKKEKTDYLIRLLLSGSHIALVSDAGMPGISDPGADLIRACLKNNIPVTAAPGPSACITGLVLSGFEIDRFVFEGFLPSAQNAKKERRNRLAALVEERRAIILYESPHHIMGTLTELVDFVAERPIAVMRELTKVYEEGIRGLAYEVLAHFQTQPPRGEMVIVIAPLPDRVVTAKADMQDQATSTSVIARIKAICEEGHDEMQAIKEVAHDMGVGKREVYKVWIAHKNTSEMNN